MRYFRLLSRLYYGSIARAEGRKHQTYIFGEGIWRKTVILTMHCTDDFGLYEEITEEQACEEIRKTEILYRGLETFCINALGRLGVPEQRMQTKDLEIRIIYMLYRMSKLTRIDIHTLEACGFHYRMLRALGILMENGEMKEDAQMEKIRSNTLVMLVKSEDIFQNGQKSENDRLIMEKKACYDDFLQL